MSRTFLKISSLPHWMAPKPLSSRKSRCMSITISAVDSGLNLNEYGLALGSSMVVASILQHSMNNMIERWRSQLARRKRDLRFQIDENGYLSYKSTDIIPTTVNCTQDSAAGGIVYCRLWDSPRGPARPGHTSHATYCTVLSILLSHQDLTRGQVLVGRRRGETWALRRSKRVSIGPKACRVAIVPDCLRPWIHRRLMDMDQMIAINPKSKRRGFDNIPAKNNINRDDHNRVSLYSCLRSILLSLACSLPGTICTQHDCCFPSRF